MAYCPNCGFYCTDGAKFCGNCGGTIMPSQPAQPVAQPQPQVQTQPQPQPQPVYQQPVQPQPVYQQPVYQQPAQLQPVYQQPVQPQPVYQQPVQPQPVQPQMQPAVQSGQNVPKVKGNGLCTAGFVLSLLGIFLVGITSLFGLLFSVIGLISAGKKKQKGKGKAIAGLVMSVLTIGGITCSFIFLANPFMDYYEKLTGRTFPTREVKIDYDDMVTKNGWVIAGDETCLHFNSKDHTFNDYLSYLQTSDMYFSGHYELYIGKDAVGYLTSAKGGSVITEEELNRLFRSDERYSEDNLVAITCVFEKFHYNGDVRDDFDQKTVRLYGFYVLDNKGDVVFEAIEAIDPESGIKYLLVDEDKFDDYRYAADSDPDETNPDETEQKENDTDETGVDDPDSNEDYPDGVDPDDVYEQDDADVSYEDDDYEP